MSDSNTRGAGVAIFYTFSWLSINNKLLNLSFTEILISTKCYIVENVMRNYYVVLFKPIRQKLFSCGHHILINEIKKTSLVEDNMVSAKMIFKIPTNQKVHISIEFDGRQ